MRPPNKPSTSVPECFANLQKRELLFFDWDDKLQLYLSFVCGWLKDTLPAATYIQFKGPGRVSTSGSHSKLTRCSCVTPHCNRAPPRSHVHEAAVLQYETIRGRSYPFWSWTWGCTRHILLELNHGFISYVIKVPPRAFMMCAVSRIGFASEPLGLYVSGHVSGRWGKHDCASHPSSVAFTHVVSASQAGIVPLVKLNGLRGVSAAITALWRIDMGGA